MLLMRRSRLDSSKFRIFNEHFQLFSSLDDSKKEKQKLRAQRFNEKMKASKNDDAPNFQSLLRQLYRRSHPDLVKSYSEEMSRVNDNSMKELNGVLSSIKTTEFPPALDKSFTFYMKDQNQSYETFELRLKTSGGECRKQLKKTFEAFFLKTGISSTPFRWDSEYFPVLKYDDARVLEKSPSENSN